ncbi:MAG: DUF418 domain-containing protein [Ectobacillus sp.]
MGMHTSEQERIHSMDAIRGFAVFGIFFVNWPSLVGIETLDQERLYTGTDAYIRLFYDLFVQTKFYTIFAFLFGLGFYIFITRAKAKTKYPSLLFIKRLLLLFLFGTLHYILLWDGDILHSYAIAGLFLALFSKRSPRTVITWSIALLSLFMLFIFVAYGGMNHSASDAKPHYTAPLENWAMHAKERFSFFIGENLLVNLIYLPETIGLFLLGLYCAKKQVFTRVPELNDKLKKIQFAALLLTLPSWYKIIQYFIEADVYNSAKVFPYILASGKTLFVFYIVSMLRMMENPKWQQRLRPFQYIGKMALTNYLSQTIITILAFGLFSAPSPLPLATGIIFCSVLFLLQIAASKWWLARFQYGPFEYIWRVGTYGKIMPFIREKSPE